MSKLDKLKKDHLVARKNKSTIAINVLGVLIGEVQTKMKDSTDSEDEILESCAKKMYKSLETIETEESKVEMSTIEPYLPQTMGKDEIKSILDTLDFSNASNFGAKMGMAMKALEGKADGNDVRLVIQENYI